jgi:predicted nucleic acid-binding protein
MKRLIDSCILIDHFNGITQATVYLKAHRDESYISVITKAAVLIGFDDDNSFEKAGELLGHFPLIDLDVNITDLVIQIRREQIKKRQLNSLTKRLFNGNCPMPFKQRSPFTIISN